MVDTKLKRASCMLTPEKHAAFKIACVKMGYTMDEWLKSSVEDALATLADCNERSRRGGGEGDGE